jgi:mono/diheme cytochrome c family protein
MKKGRAAFFCVLALLIAALTIGLLIGQASPAQNGVPAPGTASGIASGAGGGSDRSGASGASAAAATLQQGSYLTDAGNCVSCHTRSGAAPFSGGVPFITKLGTIYSSNITPDARAGIGNWSLDEFRRAMHEGIAPGGRRLFPAFPYTSFTKVSDADVAAIYAYLRTLQPVRYSPPRNGFVFRQRWAMRLWNLLFFRSGRFAPGPKQSEQWNRGAYLVEGLGHCDACHSPRNAFMAEESARAYSGGTFDEKVPGGQTRPWSAVNLTSSRTGLASWSVNELTRYLKAGFSLRAGVFGPMNDVVDNSLRNLSDADVQAMAVYLKSLPALGTDGTAPPAAALKAGTRIYSDECEECHMPSGRGGLFSAPPLSGSAVVQAGDPASLINVILYGADGPKDVSFGGWETMKPYGNVLSDAQIAAVANYVRGSWHNHGSEVTAAQVARQR